MVDRFVPAPEVRSDEIGATKNQKEVDELKRIVFLIIASLLVIGLVLPSTVAGANIDIKVLIAGPMLDVQGDHMWKGATMANTAIGTFSDGVNTYTFDLIKVDTKEISQPMGAGTILETALTNEGAKLVIGGFRTEAVYEEIPKAMAAKALMFICGAASYGLLTTPPHNTATNYTTGAKYIFRGTPFNDVFLINNALMMLAMVTTGIKAQIGSATPKVAIFAEDLEWTVAMVASAKTIIQSVLGCTLGPVKTVSDTAGADTVIPALNEIKAAKCHAILTLISGPVGTQFSTQKGDLGVPAVAVGINVPIQTPGAWAGTLGNVAYEITMGTWAKGVAQTNLTTAFLNGFETAYGTLPVYTASAHDILIAFSEAIKDEGWNPADTETSVNDLIAWFEDPANAMENTSAQKAMYYPKWAYPEMAYWIKAGKALPALCFTQYDDLYGDLGYFCDRAVGSGVGTNFTMPPFSTHDLVYGPGYVTGLGFQWQPVVTP